MSHRPRPLGPEPFAMSCTLQATLAASVILASVAAGPARAACDIKGARIEETIARKGELQEGANKQALRDLRTLRDAAIVLDTYTYVTECERVLEIVKIMAADPGKTLEKGDTDEEKAEDVAEARKPKPPVAPAGAAKAK